MKKIVEDFYLFLFPQGGKQDKAEDAPFWEKTVIILILVLVSVVYAVVS